MSNDLKAMSNEQKVTSTSNEQKVSHQKTRKKAKSDTEKDFVPFWVQLEK